MRLLRSSNLRQKFCVKFRTLFNPEPLAGLYRGNFFKKAAFYGGTALRVFYQLDRFSEDLDFSLLETDEGFSLDSYFSAIKKEFQALGIDVEIKSKQKKQKTAVESAFLKSDTSVHILKLQSNHQAWATKAKRPVKIKFKVDTQPPLGFATEEKLLLQPFSFYVKCYQISDLFAGKLHALLYRSWKNRIKGRDWYDFEWYIRQGSPVHLEHFLQRAHQSGDLIDQNSITLQDIKMLLQQRIHEIDFEQAKQDVFPFVSNSKKLDIWSQEYFTELVSRLTMT